MKNLPPEQTGLAIRVKGDLPKRVMNSIFKQSGLK
jgi:hypothetical protein